MPRHLAPHAGGRLRIVAGGILAMVTRVPVTERWEIHAEWFGSYTQGLVHDTQQPFFSPGTHYSLTQRVEIGVRVGWGLAAEAAPFFSDVGIAIQY